MNGVLELRQAIAMARRRFREEIARNPRIHYGILAILGLLLLGVWFAIGDGHRRAQDEMDAANQQLLALRRLAGQTEWRRRSAGIEQVRAQLENRLWEAESDGLAQANFQDLIVRLAERDKLEAGDIRVEIVAGTSAKFRQMTATLSGRFESETLQSFLADLMRERHFLVVDRLRIETVPAPKYTMALTTYLRPSATASAAAPSSPRS